jgi:hypothetical protein
VRCYCSVHLPQDQYFFVHEAVAEALLCGNTEVSLESLAGYVEDLYSIIPDDESETTNLELQFKVLVYPLSVLLGDEHVFVHVQRLALERNDPNRWMTASKDANKTKNRFVNVLPCKAVSASKGRGMMWCYCLICR